MSIIWLFSNIYIINEKVRFVGIYRLATKENTDNIYVYAHKSALCYALKEKESSVLKWLLLL